MENIPILPTIQSDEQIADFIATRMERAADLREMGMHKECDVLLESAYQMAVAADDTQSLGFLYAVIPTQDQ